MGYAGADLTARRKRTRRRARLPRDPYGYQDAAEAALYSRTGSAMETDAKKGRSYGASLDRQYAYKRSRIANQRPTVSTLCETGIMRLQAVKQEVPDRDPDDPAPTYPGAFSIGKGNSSSALSQLTMPLYIVDLTRVPNGPNGPTNGTGCIQQLRIGDAGNPTFNERPTQNSNGVFTSNAQYDWEKTNGNGSINATLMQHLWYDVRLKLYGARKQAVTYDVMLVRFKQDYIVWDGVAQNAQDGATRTQFWQSIARSQIVNTILPKTSGWMDYVTILRRKRLNLPASSSDDLDKSPQSVDFHWFIRDTRILKYSQNNNVFTEDIAVDGTGWNVEFSNASSGNFNQINDPHHFASRTFLLIRATDMTSVRNTGDDMDDTPSFDICVRRKTRFFPPT